VIGSADEVVERMRGTTREVDRVGAYIFAPLSDDPEQLDAPAEGVVPHLRPEGGHRELAAV
jgi:hypothetical protein